MNICFLNIQKLKEHYRISGCNTLIAEKHCQYSLISPVYHHHLGETIISIFSTSDGSDCFMVTFYWPFHLITPVFHALSMSFFNLPKYNYHQKITRSADIIYIFCHRWIQYNAAIKTSELYEHLKPVFQVAAKFKKYGFASMMVIYRWCVASFWAGSRQFMIAELRKLVDPLILTWSFRFRFETISLFFHTLHFASSFFFATSRLLWKFVW